MKREASAVAWHELPASEVLLRLGVAATGLTMQEAALRLERFGPNELRAERPVTVLDIIFRQFQSLLVWILIVAALTAGAFGEWADGIAIIAIVALNAVIGAYQEHGAERALAALRRLTGRRTRVRRDGRVIELSATEVVPGDVIELTAGDF
ncbi:MAG: cation-translocating P-type ATPase, partial [Planctomycetes bacterium]|nr:cation-translocating P-type ATPase [Planctomycetota bacterium]